MGIVVTGGAGFVLSHFVRDWARTKAEPIVVVDRSPIDDRLAAWLGDLRPRIRFIEADAGDVAAWSRSVDPGDVRTIVHGAAMTSHSFARADGRVISTEYDNPAAVIEANLVATVRLLEWARALPGLTRFLYISSGSVYGSRGASPLPEDGYVDPTALYDITKDASERIVRRYADLFGFSSASLRLSSVFGPMDRDTRDRRVHAAPYLIGRKALAGEPVKVLSMAATADWISAADIAGAILRVLEKPRLAHQAYNIAYGEPTSLGTLIEAFRAAVPGLAASEAPLEEADIKHPPDRNLGKWAAYDITRARSDLGWQPRPIAVRVAEYVDWLRSEAKRPG